MIKLSNGLERTIMNEVFSINCGGKIMAQRTQLPLDLGKGTLSPHVILQSSHICYRQLPIDMT